MKKLHINELAVKVTEAVIAHGVDPLTAWTEHNSAYRTLITIHKEKELEYLSEELVKQYVADVGARVDRGELGWSMYRRVQRGIDRLMEFSQKGSVGWTFFRKVSKFEINPYYEKIIENYLAASG